MAFSLFSRIRRSCFLFFLFFPFSSDLGAEVSIPSVTDPIEVTTDSYPFNAANRSVVQQDLNKYGYVEKEFFVSGKNQGGGDKEKNKQELIGDPLSIANDLEKTRRDALIKKKGFKVLHYYERSLSCEVLRNER